MIIFLNDEIKKKIIKFIIPNNPITIGELRISMLMLLVSPKSNEIVEYLHILLWFH